MKNNKTQHRFPLNDQVYELHLNQGEHKLHLIGGFYVNVHDARFLIQHKQTGEYVDLLMPFPVQSYKSGKRMKRISRFVIEIAGDYTFQVVNPEQIEVNKSNLYLHKLLGLENRIPMNKIEVFISGG